MLFRSDNFSGVDILMTTCLDWAVRYGMTLPQNFISYRSRIDEEPSTAIAFAANAVR